jgi:hypothetical protein
MIGFAFGAGEIARGRFRAARGCTSHRRLWQHFFILNEFARPSVEAALKKPPAFSGL